MLARLRSTRPARGRRSELDDRVADEHTMAGRRVPLSRRPFPKPCEIAEGATRRPRGQTVWSREQEGVDEEVVWLRAVANSAMHSALAQGNGQAARPAAFKGTRA